MNFQIDVLSLTGKLYSGEAEKVTIPSLTGEMTVLARHMPVVAPLVTGEVIVKTPKETLNLSIGKGVFEFSEGRARLLIEDVASADEISEERALEAKKRAEELLAKGIGEEAKHQIMYQLRKSLIDLKIARKRKKNL